MNYFITIKLLFLFLLLNCSTVKVNVRSLSFEKEVPKRVLISYETGTNLSKIEMEIFADILRNHASHHKEYIIYPNEEGIQSCSDNKKNIEGIVSYKVKQKDTKEKLSIHLITSLTNCKLSKVIWQSESDETYSKGSQENLSLVNEYVSKYGKEYESHINPYYQSIRLNLDSLESPILGEKEKEEKIEIDSE